MPKYHCLDTEVQLYTSEFVFHHTLLEPSDAAKQSPGRKHSFTTTDYKFREDTPACNGLHNTTRRFRKKRLTEQRFKGHERLDFLGLETPFFLICAGKDASDVKLSPLSLQPSTVLPSPHALNLRTQVPELHIDEHVFANSTVNIIDQNGSNLTSSATLLEDATGLAKHNRKLSENLKLDALSNPLEVVVRLSESSFISPNLTTETSRYDVCINIFYNGEFSASHVIKYGTSALNGGKTCVRLAGRRFASNRELPWKIGIKSESASNFLNSSSSSLPVSTPDERWGKLVAALNVEASEWGRDECGDRCPTGKYLELLSKMTIPTELKRPLAGTGYGFGVIDVVITLGRFSCVDVSKEVASPIRYLHTSQRQMAGILSDQERRHKIAATVTESFTDSSRSCPRSISGAVNCPMEIDPEVISRSPMTDKRPHIFNVQIDHQGQNFSDSQDALIPSLDLMPRSSTARAFTRQTTPMTPNTPLGVAKPSTTRPPHPYRPENVPQKRYRGTEPELLILPSPKRRGKAKAFEELPVDLSAATFMSTRAKRNANDSFTKPLPNEEEVTSITKEDSFYPPTNIPGNSESSEMTIVKPPLTPRRKSSKNPQTPVFGGYSKKKSRSSNYNPKLSNRPQNLRRKNSAGEWVIPPCRKNSFGEWETPTKGGQNINSGSQKSRMNEAISGEKEKISRPAFDISTNNNSRDSEIGSRSPSIIPSIKQKRATIKFMGPAKVSEQPGNSLAPAILTAIKGEHMINSSGAGQSIEIATLATATHFVNPISKNLVEGSCDKPGNDLMEAITSKATNVFDTCSMEPNKDDSVIESGSNSKKKSLRMRFFKSDLSYSGDMADGKHSTRRWLVERCVSSEYTLGKDFINNLTSKPHQYEKPDQPLGLSNISRCEMVIDMIEGPGFRETTKLQSEFIADESRRQTTTSRQHKVIAPSQETRKLDSDLQLVPPNRSLRTLKLVRRRSIPSTGNEINNNSKCSFGQGPLSYRPNDIVIVNNGDMKEDCIPSASKTYGNIPKSVHQDSDPINSVTPLSTKGISEMFTTAPASVTNQHGPETGKSMEAQFSSENREHTKTPAGTIYTERLFRPRTVGSTELKALLESNDRHSVVENPPCTPLGIIESRLMTRSSRKTVSLTSQKDIGQSRAFADTKSFRDNPASKNLVANKGPKRIRGSSGQFVRKPSITTTPIRNRIVNANISQPKTVTTQAESDISMSNVTDGIQNSYRRKSTAEEAETRSTTSKSYDLGASVGGSKVVVQAMSNAMKLDEAAEEVDVALKQVSRAKTEINKAARDFECLKTHSQAPRKISIVNTEEKSNTAAETLPRGIPKIQEHSNVASTPFNQDSRSWEPNYLCQDSILTYAGAENWPGMDMDPDTGRAFRKIREQEVGYFKASGVLMGVRYVVVGSAGVEVFVNE